jgi:hypothetical protein
MNLLQEYYVAWENEYKCKLEGYIASSSSGTIKRAQMQFKTSTREVSDVQFPIFQSQKWFRKEYGLECCDIPDLVLRYSGEESV